MSALKSIPTGELAPDPKPPEGTPPSAAEVAREVRRRRARRLARMLALWVVLPTVLSALYFFAIAREEYQSVTTQAVRGGGNQIGAMLLEYLQSRDMLAQLEQRTHFSEHYVANGDPIFGLSADAGSETRYRAFRHVVSAGYDNASGVVTIVVRAYSGRAAQEHARALVQQSQLFLDSLGESADHARLTQIAPPSLANEASYPRRGYGVLTAFFVSLAVFVIGSLLIMAVREHAQF